MLSRRDVLNTTLAAGAGLAMASQTEPAPAQRQLDESPRHRIGVEAEIALRERVEAWALDP